MSTMTIFTGMKAVAVTAAISLLVLTATDADPDVPAPPAAQEPGHEERFDLDAGGCRWSEFFPRPLPGRLSGCVCRGDGVLPGEGRTDEEGRYKIVSGGATTGRFEVVVAAAGYVPSHIGSGLGMTSVRRGSSKRRPLAASCGTSRGGRSRGSRVFPMASPFATVWPEMYTSPNGGLAIATTDRRGFGGPRPCRLGPIR